VTDDVVDDGQRVRTKAAVLEDRADARVERGVTRRSGGRQGRAGRDDRYREGPREEKCGS